MKITMKYPGWISKTLTLSYDDNVSQDIRLIETMHKYGIKGTFNINSEMFSPADTTSDPSTLTRRLTEKELFDTITKYGMEPALHGKKHLSLAKVTPEEAYDDVYCDRLNLEKMFSRPVRGMAYANGSWNEDVVEILRRAGVAYSRTVHSTLSFGYPENWLALNPTCHHNNDALFDLADKFIAEEPEETIMFYLWGHSYEFSNDNNWDRIEDFFKKISGRDDIWYATNIEIYEYIHAFKSLVLGADNKYVFNPTAFDLYFIADGRNVVVKSGETVAL